MGRRTQVFPIPGFPRQCCQAPEIPTRSREIPCGPALSGLGCSLCRSASGGASGFSEPQLHSTRSLPPPAPPRSAPPCPGPHYSLPVRKGFLLIHFFLHLFIHLSYSKFLTTDYVFTWSGSCSSQQPQLMSLLWVTTVLATAVHARPFT